MDKSDEILMKEGGGEPADDGDPKGQDQPRTSMIGPSESRPKSKQLYGAQCVKELAKKLCDLGVSMCTEDGQYKDLRKAPMGRMYDKPSIAKELLEDILSKLSDSRSEWTDNSKDNQKEIGMSVKKMLGDFMLDVHKNAFVDPIYVLLYANEEPPESLYTLPFSDYPEDQDSDSDDDDIDSDSDIGDDKFDDDDDPDTLASSWVNPMTQDKDNLKVKNKVIKVNDKRVTELEKQLGDQQKILAHISKVLENIVDSSLNDDDSKNQARRDRKKPAASGNPQLEGAKRINNSIKDFLAQV